MALDRITSKIQTELGSDYKCCVFGPLTRIRTPFTYPDGDLIDIYYMPTSSILVDLGETLRWFHSLDKEKPKLKLPPDIRLYKGVLRLYNCQPTKEEVEHLALTITYLTSLHETTNTLQAHKESIYSLLGDRD